MTETNRKNVVLFTVRNNEQEPTFRKLGEERRPRHASVSHLLLLLLLPWRLVTY